MAIAVTCPSCRANFRVDDKYAGREGPCPKCKTKIAIPKIEKVVVHEEDISSVSAATVAGSKAPQRNIRPIARTEVQFRVGPAIAIGGMIIAMFAAAYFARGMLLSHPPLRALGLFLVSLPASIGAYSILRNDELEPYRGAALWMRTVACGLVHTAIWVGIYFIPADLKSAGYSWIFIAPPAAAIAGAIAMVLYDIEFGSGVMHYLWFLALSLLLGYVGGLGWPWTTSAVPAVFVGS